MRGWWERRDDPNVLWLFFEAPSPNPNLIPVPNASPNPTNPNPNPNPNPEPNQDLADDLPRSVARIAAWMGVPCDAPLLETVCARSSFEFMAAEVQCGHGSTLGIAWPLRCSIWYWSDRVSLGCSMAIVLE